MQRTVPRGADDEEALAAELVKLARQYGCYGYRRVTAPAAQRRLGSEPQAGSKFIATAVQKWLRRLA